MAEMTYYLPLWVTVATIIGSIIFDVYFIKRVYKWLKGKRNQLGA